jgi:hypothetical protein
VVHPGKLRAWSLAAVMVLFQTAGGLYANSALDPEEIYENQSARIVFRLNKEVDVEVTSLPKVKHVFIDGPSTSVQRSFSILNGKTSQSVTYDVVFQITVDKPGRYSIPPIRIRAGGQDISGRRHTLVVKKGQAPAARGIWDMFRGFGRGPTVRGFSKARLYTLPAKPYVGQLFGAWYHIETRNHRYPVINLRKSSLPDFRNFFHKSIQIEAPPSPYPVTPGYERPAIEGFHYLAAAWQEGPLSIEKHSLVIADRANVQPSQARVEAHQIQVRPLPEAGRPASFSGLVGEFSMELQLPGQRTWEAGRNITAELNISGKGNFYFLKKPQLESDGLLQEVHHNIRQQEMPIDPSEPLGMVRYAIDLSASRPGKSGKAGYSLSWFNPRTARYETAQVSLPVLKFTPHKQVRLEGPRGFQGEDNLFLLGLVLAVLVAGSLLLRRLGTTRLQSVFEKTGLQTWLPAAPQSNPGLSLLRQICGQKKGKLLERHLKQAGFTWSEINQIRTLQESSRPGRFRKGDLEFLKEMYSKL